MKILTCYDYPKINSFKQEKNISRNVYFTKPAFDSFSKTKSPSFKSAERVKAIVEKYSPKSNFMSRNARKNILERFFSSFDRSPEFVNVPECINSLLREFKDEPAILTDLLAFVTDLAATWTYSPMSKLVEEKEIDSSTKNLLTEIYKKSPEDFLTLIKTKNYDNDSLVSQFFKNEDAEDIMYSVFDGRNDLLTEAVLTPECNGYTYAHRIFVQKYLKLVEKLKDTPENLAKVMSTYETCFNSTSVASNHFGVFELAIKALDGRPDLQKKVIDTLREGWVSAGSDYFKKLIADFNEQDNDKDVRDVYEKYKSNIVSHLSYRPTEFSTYKELFKKHPDIVKNMFFEEKHNDKSLAEIYAREYPTGFYDVLEEFKDDTTLIESLKTAKTSNDEYLANILPPDDRISLIFGEDYAEIRNKVKLKEIQEMRMGNDVFFQVLDANKDNKEVLNILINKVKELNLHKLGPTKALQLIELESFLNRDPAKPVSRSAAAHLALNKSPVDYFEDNSVKRLADYHKVISTVPSLITGVYSEKGVDSVINKLWKRTIYPELRQEFLNEIFNFLKDHPELLANQFTGGQALEMLYKDKLDELPKLYNLIRNAKNYGEFKYFVAHEANYTNKPQFYKEAKAILDKCELLDKIAREYNPVALADDQVLHLMGRIDELGAGIINVTFERAGRPLIHAFAEVNVTDENHEQYMKIIEQLKNVKIDWNLKDIMQIPLIEKIIDAENDIMLDLIGDKSIEWGPYLDYAYKRIKSDEFKEKIKSVNFTFPDINEAIRVRSVEAFEKVVTQLDSPLCNKEKTFAVVFPEIKKINDKTVRNQFIKLLTEHV